ncbi:hypothetical protein RvY_01127 [Ramazzottius varieornatus]|uniref:Uncharacterized protein n=1 Tax=Ramazzottius varieornatus TaxID=947166 RepID=A0A1D1UL98_RAMVA|nr:hypothetical protein RvY_01127 [Ramazzottius varieornatus]
MARVTCVAISSTNTLGRKPIRLVLSCCEIRKTHKRRWTRLTEPIQSSALDPTD